MVGRDILLGSAIGFFSVLLGHLRVASVIWFTGRGGLPDLMDGWQFGLAGPSAFGQMFINQVSASIVTAFMIVFLLLFLSLLLRRDWAGIAVGTLILIALFVAPAIGREHWLALLAVACSNVLLVICAMRFGPLALTTALIVVHVWVFFPITTNLTAWYASSFVLVTAILLAIATYSFYVSLGGQKVFSGKLLEE